MGMVTLIVTVTLDRQPEIPQREVRTGAAATPEEFEAISEVCLPGERGLVTGCWEQLCPPALSLAELTRCACPVRPCRGFWVDLCTPDPSACEVQGAAFHGAVCSQRRRNGAP